MHCLHTCEWECDSLPVPDSLACHIIITVVNSTGPEFEPWHSHFPAVESTLNRFN